MVQGLNSAISLNFGNTIFYLTNILDISNSGPPKTPWAPQDGPSLYQGTDFVNITYCSDHSFCHKILIFV